MKKSELFMLQNGLNSCGNLSGVKFAYAIAKNLKMVNAEIDNLQSSMEASDDMKEYEQKRIKLAADHSIKEEDGKPRIADSRYIIADQAAFDLALKELREQYKETLEDAEKKNKEYEEMLKEESDIKLFMVKEDIIPDNITAQQMTGIIEIIEN